MTSPKRRNAPLRAMGFLSALERSFLDALRTPEGTAEPIALLWTDADRQWVGLLAWLRTVLPQVFTLGSYNPAERTGPAVWLRCVVDRVLADVPVPDGTVPILYLPGVARQTLRAGKECPRELQPLVELQYRGRVWHQRNGRDWSLDAFLVSEDGLGLDVAQDTRTREAALRSLALLVETPLEGLRGHRLEADDFAANTEYAHGGISLQECVVPELVVERGGAAAGATIAAVSWRGMRCRVTVTTTDPALRIDLRLNWKQTASSIAAAAKELGPAGEASLAVADDAHEGAAATVVVLDATGNVLARKPTTVGEGS